MKRGTTFFDIGKSASLGIGILNRETRQKRERGQDSGAYDGMVRVVRIFRRLPGFSMSQVKEIAVNRTV
jgi:hypothetical protein